MKKILLAAAMLLPFILISCDPTPPSFEDLSPKFKTNKEVYITSAVLEGGFQYYEAEGTPTIYFMIGKDATTLETSGKKVNAEIISTSTLIKGGESMIDVQVRGSFDNLDPGTDYYCIIVANKGGSKWTSSTEKITTKDIQFTVTTEDVTDLKSYSATLSGSAKFSGSDAAGCSPSITFVVADTSSEVEEVLATIKKNRMIPFEEDHPGELLQGSILPDAQGNTAPGDNKLGYGYATDYSTTYYYAVVVKVMDVVVCGNVKSFTTPFIEGAVDLGLSVYWADCNLGASSPEQYGDYYAWGETETKDEFNFGNYKWGTIKNAGDSWWVHLFKYMGSVTSYDTDVDLLYMFETRWAVDGIEKKIHVYYSIDDEVDGLYTLSEEDDAASVILGGNWKIPSQDEWQELCDNCTWTYSKRDNVEGYEVKSKINGNSIFLPSAGFINHSTSWKKGSDGDYHPSFEKIVEKDTGRYWSSGLSKKTHLREYEDFSGDIRYKYVEVPVYPDYFLTNIKEIDTREAILRWNGLSIRPVYSTKSKEE